MQQSWGTVFAETLDLQECGSDITATASPGQPESDWNVRKLQSLRDRKVQICSAFTSVSFAPSPPADEWHRGFAGGQREEGNLCSVSSETLEVLLM